jgi:hypothetical protein
LGDIPIKLTIWSPEHGIEASTPVVLDNEYFQLYWSPDEHGLQLVSSTGHAKYDQIFTLNGNVLLRVAIPDQWPDLIGWTTDGNAMMRLWYSGPGPQLLMINTRTGRLFVVATEDIFGSDTSHDGQFMLLATRQGQTYRVEIARIDGTKRKLLMQDTLPADLDYPGFTFSSSYVPWSPTWSPNSKYVAQEWFNADYTRHQTIVGQPDSSRKQVVDGLLVGWIEQDWLIYVDNSSQHLRLLKADAGTQFDLGKVNLKTFTSHNTWIRVSPDKRTLLKSSQGQDLLFVSLSESDPWIRSVDLGSDVNFFDLGVDQNPNSIIQIPQSLAWSPDSAMATVVYNGTLVTDGMLKVFSRDGKMLLQAPFNLDPIGGSFAQLSVVWTSCE